MFSKLISVRILSGVPVLACLCSLLVAVAAPAPVSARAPDPRAQSGSAQRIAAVVNNDVISVRDLNTRMALVMATSGMPNTPEVAQRVAPQILRALIEETLKLQEATRAGTIASPEEIQGGVRRLEQQNGMPPGALERNLRAAGLEWDAVLRQVKAEISWVNYVRRTLLGRASVSPEELAIYENQLKRNLGQPEYLIANIFLAVDSPGQEAEVRALADRLLEQLRKGASFGALARQFSRSASAERSGDMGWVAPGDFDPEVLEALSTMQAGNVSRPIRTYGGYEIVLLRSKRTAGSAGNGTPLARIVLPSAGPQALPPDRFQALRSQVSTLRGCEAFNRLAEELGAPSAPVAMVGPESLAPEIRSRIQGLGVGQVSPALKFDDGEAYFMVCERPPEGIPPRDELRDRLVQRKLEGLSQRRLRDLRQQAIIDIRI
ncbi:peptidylprolyl isomerase [Phaeovibrio sulfidiphilus]|uniref:Parvulin-like PPIase n=1 Tax=Phaeovibrio sulfidiphilus TaxID=1220600 RepID=A0A8J7CDM2_9PROT|nr:peptidylprolyl isomerase [Phaeovibrio sulfidiphilus]